MNCTSHGSQSHFSLAEQGCRGCFPKRHHQSENTIACFQSKLKHCCQWPLEGGLWSCSQLLLVRVGIPKQADAGVPKYFGDRLQLDTPNRLCWAWNFYLLIPSHAPVPLQLTYLGAVTAPLPCLVVSWDLWGYQGQRGSRRGLSPGAVPQGGPAAELLWAQFSFCLSHHYISHLSSYPHFFLAMHNIGGYAWGVKVSVW